VALESKHLKDIEEDVVDRVWSLFGQTIHTILERSEHTAMTEKRLTITRQDWVISGQFDRFAADEGVLSEYKVTSTYSVKDGGKEDWEAQLNILAHILREHGHPVKSLQVCVILRDWRRSLADRSQDYPHSPVLTINVPLWSEERCEEFIDHRIRLHQAARLALPECSSEERWASPDIWALMKEGRKTAVRLFESEPEAQAALEEAGPKHFLEHRPGKDTRCESYCPAAPFCDQWRRKHTNQGTVSVIDVSRDKAA
jgi:hypothetical protein